MIVDRSSKIMLTVCGLALLGIFAYIALNPIAITLSLSNEIRGQMPFGTWEIVEVKDYKLDNNTLRFSYLKASEKNGIVMERINYGSGWNEYPRVEARFFFVFVPNVKTVLYEDTLRPQLIHEKTPAQWQLRKPTEEVFDIGVAVSNEKPVFNFKLNSNSN